MLYLQLFWEFFKTGLFAVGGGLATLPFLQDMADRTGWFTHAQLADMLAVSESTPGPIGVNMATYVGFTTGGIGGALVATIGLVTPSVIVILIVAAFLKAFRDSKWVSAAFYGLRPASTALVAAAGISVVTYRPAPQRHNRSGRAELAGYRPGDRTAGVYQLGTCGEKVAPHRVHRHFRPGGCSAEILRKGRRCASPFLYIFPPGRADYRCYTVRRFIFYV